MSGTTSIVIFGASGDLTRRKLIPALFNLCRKDRLPGNFHVIGVSRSPFSDEEFRERMRGGVDEFADYDFSEAEWANFAERIEYEAGDLREPEDLAGLEKRLRRVEEANDGPANRLYYLAIAPKLYEKNIANLAAAGMVDESNGWRRVVIEKPFGHDLPSALALNESIHKVLKESQIYRIDHYLGKETVQNILIFRFANILFEPVWNRNYIDHVQITAAETVDVGHRAGYYDGVGVVRDMVQNHVLQLLSLVAMEPPASFEADALRDEKAKLFKAIRPIRAADVAHHTVRGQYRGYREAEGVAPNSQTATYVAMRLYIDNWRWQGVPFYLRSGKAMAQKTTDITICFKRPPHLMFPIPEGRHIPPNSLSLCIQPDEGIHFAFQAKVPDTTADMRSVDMEFHYADSFHGSSIPEAYERLLEDALKGYAALFNRADAVEMAWAFVDPILAGWEAAGSVPIEIYEPGSWGPAGADDLLKQDGFSWTLGCGDIHSHVQVENL